MLVFMWPPTRPFLNISMFRVYTLGAAWKAPLDPTVCRLISGFVTLQSGFCVALTGGTDALGPSVRRFSSAIGVHPPSAVVKVGHATPVTAPAVIAPASGEREAQQRCAHNRKSARLSLGRIKKTRGPSKHFFWVFDLMQGVCTPVTALPRLLLKGMPFHGAFMYLCVRASIYNSPRAQRISKKHKCTEHLIRL